MQIALDGPAGAGKSTVAKALARELKFVYLDTGAMYRAVGLFMTQAKVSDEAGVNALLPQVQLEITYCDGEQAVFLNGRNVSDDIRTEEISRAASYFSKMPCVRTFLVKMQQELASRSDSILDGRDIGTVVLPHADFKFYLTADADERARRRVEQMREKGVELNYEEVLQDIIKRDEQDMNREVSPLKQAEDARLIDSTHLTQEEVINHILQIVKAGA